MKKTFTITEGKGFTIQFDNGIVLSTQFGSMNYCENRSMNISSEFPKFKESNNAEIAVWNEKGDWVTKQMMKELGKETNDDVEGWVKLSGWLKILDWCRNQ